MPGARDHWVLAICSALLSIEAMDMHVRHDHKTKVAAALPKPAKRVGMKDANAARIGLRVEFVVVHKRTGVSPVLQFVAEKECA